MRQSVASGTAAVLVAALALAIAAAGVRPGEIDGLDQAHHLMDGLFFADLYADQPIDRLTSYPFEYYAQYPALGFTFWPPVFPAIEGVAFTIFGRSVVAAQGCLAVFVVLLSVLVFVLARQSLSWPFAALAAALAVSTPWLVEHARTLMLEIPALTLTLTTLWLYQRVTRRGRWTGPGEAVLFGLVAASAVYTKQPTVFLFPALLADALLHHRPLVRCRSNFLAVAVLIVACLPLAAFTLRYGSVNLAQSFGNQGDVYVTGHKTASRWSLDGWTYYARLISETLPWLVSGLVLTAGVLAVVHPVFRRRQGVWLAWLASWYVLFTLFDNKQPRFVTFAVPALTVLAMSVADLWAAQRRWAGPILAGSLAAVLTYQGWAAASQTVSGYTGMDRVIASILRENRSGHIAYFGQYRQLFVPSVRLLDSSRTIHVLQGDDIRSASASLTAACHDYRVRWLVVETNDPIVAELSTAALHERQRTTVASPQHVISLMVLEHVGPVAERMKPPPLRSKLQGLHHR